jgi:hypothetical protein
MSIDNATQNFKLYFHVGAGKTGTSSIQETLRLNREKLLSQGVWYLGLMLEYAPVVRYPWQCAGGFSLLNSQSEETIAKEFFEIIDESLTQIRLTGLHTVILSNESFFHKIPSIHETVQKLCTKGWEIDLVAYVRRHDAWAKSAYIQWGLNHKSYVGELKPFNEWIKRSPHFFGHSLIAWSSITGLNCNFRNFDSVKDVVDDFCAIVGLPVSELSRQHINIQPSPEELFLRSLFNSQFSGEVLPVQFNRQLGIKQIDSSFSATTFIDEYLPSENELAALLDRCSEDIAVVNRLLAQSGQPPIDLTPKKFSNQAVDMGKLAASMFQILLQQAMRIKQLEEKVNQVVNGTVKGV